MDSSVIGLLFIVFVESIKSVFSSFALEFNNDSYTFLASSVIDISFSLDSISCSRKTGSVFSNIGCSSKKISSFSKFLSTFFSFLILLVLAILNVLPFTVIVFLSSTFTAVLINFPIFHAFKTAQPPKKIVPTCCITENPEPKK